MFLDFKAMGGPALPQTPGAARFGAAGGLIGRSPDCTLPLPDPTRQISRQHVEVRCHGGEFSLKVVSEANGIVVNDAYVQPGASMVVAHGDRVAIGDYQFVVAVTAPAPHPAADPFAGLIAPPAPMSGWAAPPPAPVAGSVFDDILGAILPAPVPPAPRYAPPLAAHQLDDLLGSLSGAAGGSTATGTGTATLPGFTPGSRGDATRAPQLTKPPMSPAPPVAWVPAAPPATDLTDDVFDMAGFGAGAVDSDDIFGALAADFGLSPTPPPASVPASLPTVAPPPTLVPAMGPTAVAAAGPVSVGITHPAGGGAPAGQVLAGGPSGAELVQLLCKTLQLEPGTLDESRPEATVELVGQLLRLSLEGVHRLLEMRAQLKGELGVEDRTTISKAANNPLKQSESLKDAVTYLTDLRRHNTKLFMPPGEAVEDAMWDICSHEMALMAGMRAALLASLKMFAPEAVEGRIKKSGALDSVIPGLYKSKLWDRFLVMYGEIQREAEDHFDQLLNQEFAKAYGEQTKKLRRKTAKPAKDAPKP